MAKKRAMILHIVALAVNLTAFHSRHDVVLLVQLFLGVATETDWLAFESCGEKRRGCQGGPQLLLRSLDTPLQYLAEIAVAAVCHLARFDDGQAAAIFRWLLTGNGVGMARWIPRARTMKGTPHRLVAIASYRRASAAWGSARTAA